MKEEQFKHFEKILVRQTDEQAWRCRFFSNYEEDDYPFVTTGGVRYAQCIPYEGNEHLVDKTDAPWEQKNEIEWQPKDGDFVVNTMLRNARAFIYRESSSTDETSGCYCGLYPEDDIIYIALGNGAGWSGVNLRPATDEEKKELINALHKKGKDWNFTKKEIINYQWKPKYGENYYSIDYLEGTFSTEIYIWHNNQIDIYYQKKGWVFKTEEKAQELVNKLNTAIKNIK